MVADGASLVVRTLRAIGVDTVFGYIGNSILPVFDRLIGSGIRLVTPMSETGAAHAADGYARAGGKLGVVLATSGPGATNLLTGIATAYMDSVPLLAVTANVARSKLGKDAFQEVDISGIVTPVTKYTRIVSSADEIEAELKKGAAIACSGRKGPVLIDIPCDLLLQAAIYRDLPLPDYPLREDRTQLERAADLIAKSQRPVILAGGGAVGAAQAVHALAAKLSAPIFTTMRAVGLTDSPYLIGMIGSSAPAANNRLYRKSDLVIALGTRFSDKMHARPAPKQRYVHIDLDPAELDKIVPAAAKLRMTVADGIEALLPLCPRREAPLPLPPVRTAKKPLDRLAAAVAASLGDDALIATDVGCHQVALLNALPPHVGAERIVTSAGLGTMGFGLPASLGAHLATGKPVVLFSGDGSFNMSFNELPALLRYNVPIAIVIANNHSLQMIERIQQKQCNGRTIAVETPPIAYEKLAKALGYRGIRCSVRTAPAAIRDALDSKTPTIINVTVR